MPERQLDFRYVGTFLKNVGVRIKAEPGEYVVMRGSRFDPGPTQECRGFDDLHEAFIYGLQLALLPPFYRQRPKRYKPNSTGHNARAYEIRRQQAEARRHEIEAERAAVATRREAMIRAELAKLGGSS
jgi:hypothetical protein